MINPGSTWFAADLERYSNKYRVKLLSAHKEILNFQVESWPHLLMVSEDGFEKGPCTIALQSELFNEFQQRARSATRIFFNNQALRVFVGNNDYSINWREGERLSFAPFKIDNLKHNSVCTSLEQYCQALEDRDLNTPSAVLLGMTGGSEYFREKIYYYYPEIINALLLRDEHQFIYSCRKIIGMGYGSSPNGDDLICGALLSFHHFTADQSFIDNISAELKAETGKTNLMGGHMIEIGLSGLTPYFFQALLVSIIEGRFEQALLTRTFKVGASTGSDLLIALILFIKSYLAST